MRDYWLAPINNTHIFEGESDVVRSREVACVEQSHCQVLIVQGTSKHHVSDIWTLIALARVLDDGGRNKLTLLAQLVLVDGYHLPGRWEGENGLKQTSTHTHTHTQFLTKHSVCIGYAKGSAV